MKKHNAGSGGARLRQVAVLILLLICIVTSPASAQNVQRFADIGNLVLESGDTVYNCRIGYRTAGALNADSSNVIVYLTWFGGMSENLYSLMGSSRILDTTGRFVIMIDALGNGVSTSASHPNEKNAKAFAALSISDMAASQYVLLTEHLGFRKIHAVMGGSMGSMQALQWMVQYPGYAEKCIAYVPTPKPSVYDQLYWNLMLNVMQSGIDYGVPPKVYMKSVNLFNHLTGRTPDYFVEHTTQEQFDTILARSYREPSAVFTPQNQISQLQAMLRHDIYRYTGGKPITDFIGGNTLLIVSEQDHILHPSTSVKLAEETGCRLHLFDSDCGHLAVNCLMEETRMLIEDFLGQQRK
ncbi:MAG: alpha/beta fold hydrolase [Ignavibacteriaceae bacterium]|nr:alpha/beta fold hydrolase [Ignavibacteriaceae bacterium]